MSRYHKKQKTTPTSTVAEAPASSRTVAEAFAAVRAEIEAVPEKQLIRINVDIPRAARRGLVASERVEPLLDELAELGRFDVRPVRMLGLYALALLHTHDLVTEGGSDLPPLPVLVAEATPLRERLLRTAELLALYGLVPTERVAAIRRGHGHADTAGDLQALGRMYIELWSKVHDKIIAKREDVDRAIVLSTQLQRALAEQEVERNPLTRHKSRRHLRAQAYTLFHRAYEETRRGVTFLRWYDGGAQGIVPTLYARKARRPGTVVEDASATGMDTPVELGRATDGIEPTPPPMMSTDELVAHG